MITATRYHDFSAGHRVAGHENACARIHGHNYRVHFTIEAPELDGVGRVLDFSVIKEKLCMWLEREWDHKFLAWKDDEVFQALKRISTSFVSDEVVDIRGKQHKGKAAQHLVSSLSGALDILSDVLLTDVVWTSFNPTAENMAHYLLNYVGPVELAGTNARLIEVRIEETRKCSATARL